MPISGPTLSQFLDRIKTIQEEEQARRYAEKSARKTRKRKEAFEEQSQDLPPNWDSMPDWLKKAWKEGKLGGLLGGEGGLGGYGYGGLTGLAGRNPGSWTGIGGNLSGLTGLADKYGGGGLTGIGGGGGGGGDRTAWSALGGLLGGLFG